MKRVVLFGLVLGLISIVRAQEGGTPNSVWMYVGNTWWDSQSYASAGRRVTVAVGGEIHFVWTQSGATPYYREAYYNCWNTEAGNLLNENGLPNGGEWRSGYPTVCSGPFGHALSVYHVNATSSTYLQGLIEFLPCTGAFQQFIPPFPEPTTISLYGKADVDLEGRLQTVGILDGDPVQMFHARGIPIYDEGFGTGIEWGDIVAFESNSYVYNTADIACARESERVAIAWIVDPPGLNDPENVVMRISEDGGMNWNPDVVHVTNLPPIDTSCVLAPEICNGDTFRPWRDLSVLFDGNDNAHIAFSASGFYYFDENGESNPSRTIRSTIWHWSEETEQFSLIAEAWQVPDSSVHLGVIDLMCQKPSLAIDTTTGFLYCAFQQFDLHAYSATGYAMGEYYCSMSRDNGQNWSVPTNVSNTPGESNMPEIANHPSERDIVIAKYVNEGGIHAQYIHDRSAGTYFSDEGLPTENEVVYMRTPVEDIAAFPLQEQWEFSATQSDVPDTRAELPSEFMLYPNYPNPFNPSTTLQFDLAKAGDVKLTVFDVLGKEVATLVDGRMNAGVHSVRFDGEKFASGVYFARLSAGELAMTRKMVLLK